MRSSLRRAAAGEGAEAHDLQSGEVFGACRSGRRRLGARSSVRRRGDVFLGACRRGRRRGGLQLYQLWAARGATGQFSGIWLGLWVSASGGAAQSASMTTRAPAHEHSAHAASCRWRKHAAHFQHALRSGLMASAWRPAQNVPKVSRYRASRTHRTCVLSSFALKNLRRQRSCAQQAAALLLGLHAVAGHHV